MGNSSYKRMAAFYHNQQTDYENWLRKNTIGQYRQVYRHTRSQRAKAAMTMALASGSSQLFLIKRCVNNGIECNKKRLRADSCNTFSQGK